MTMRPILTDEDHQAALLEVEALWGAPADSPDGDRLERLIDLVGAYERVRWPIPSQS